MVTEGCLNYSWIYMVKLINIIVKPTTSKQSMQILYLCSADEASEEIDGSLVSLLQRDEIVRKVTQIFCLERLASGDTTTARTLLANIVAVRL